ncbi:MAG: type III pantothenate kinase [Dehalococcoidia bacterium]|nr:type III pantothenate kinase [Dehalococcoidia bacterium]
MMLVMDVSNTVVTMGVLVGDNLQSTWRFSTDVHKTSDEYGVLLMELFSHGGVKLSDIDHAVLGSVVPSLTATFQEVCQRYLGTTALVVEAGIRTGVRILVDNPKEVGADRVVNSLAAFRIYGGPTIVIDFSTATTFDAISREGDYLGCVISPGIGVASDALFDRTAKLSRVELVRPKSAIGKNTVAAIQSGLIFGYVGLVEGIVVRMKRELGGNARVIATGGQADLIAKETTMVEVVDQDLTLKGLKFIYELNREGR